MLILNKYNSNNELGQDMVEFALILPIFLLMLCGIIDYGWIMSRQNELTNVAGEAARYAAIYADDSDVEEKTKEFINQNVTDGNPSIDSISINETYASVKISEDVNYLTGFTGTITGGKNYVKLHAEATMPVEPYQTNDGEEEEEEEEESEG